MGRRPTRRRRLASLQSREDLIFFALPPNAHIESATVPAGFQLRCVDHLEQMTDELRAAVVGDPDWNILVWRMLRKEARLVVLLNSSEQAVAYGWIQGWRPFRRLFSDVANDPIMIGPAHTFPAHRGQGYHAIVLRARLALIPSGKTAVTFAERTNRASIKGIEAVGFRRVAEILLTRYLRFFKRATPVWRSSQI